MAKKLHIAQIAAEIEPFTKSGGLASVVGSLPRVQKKLGHKVIVITPFYEGATNVGDQALEVVAENVEIETTAGELHKATYLKGRLPDSTVPVYFVVSDKFFGRRESLQGENGPKLYGTRDDNARFAFFDVAALDLLKRIGSRPDVIHCHDWHTGLIPYFLKWRYRKDPFWHKTSTLFTIHNLVYQLGHDWWLIPEKDRDDGRTQLPPLSEPSRIEKVNFVKRAIANADAINAVSETYRDEILTKDFGEELHRMLRSREEMIFGIVNGIDYNEYNPLTDQGLRARYSHKSLGRRKENKLWIQRKLGMKAKATIPMVVMTSRVTEQKGFALTIPLVPTFMELGVQMVVMGDGDPKMVEELKALQAKFPGQFVYLPFEKELETSLYAGSDFFLLPSRFEPCGINQLIAMRYGCIPIVHHIGGLADTVVDFDAAEESGKGIGNGFTFDSYDERSLLIAFVRALETYKHKEVWKRLVVRALREANSWNIPAKKYLELYRTTMRIRKNLLKKKQ